MTQEELIKFENAVIAQARLLYPGKSCFSSRELNPIREQLKASQDKMRVEPLPKEEPRKEEPNAPVIEKKKPGRPKRK